MIGVFLSQFWVQRLGWTLLHFLWQGTAIVVVYAMLRRMLGTLLGAQGRYALACLALAAMTVAPPLTFVLIRDARGSAGWTLSAAESQRLLPVVVAIWLLGVLAFSIRLFGGWRFAARLRSTAHPAPAEWQPTLERIAAQVDVPLSRARLLVSSLVSVPTVIGWLRPAILVPFESLTGLSFEYITALLAHEMAHIRRHDYLASVLQSIAEAVLFYHPAVWWISGQIRAEREMCCDDLAVAASGDVLTYARALAELESRQPSRLAPVLAANGGSLANRIRRLIEPTHASSDSLPGPGAAWAMTLLWLAGVGVAAVHGAQTPPPPPVVVTLPALSSPVAARQSPFAEVASRARNTLLYDPVFSAQLAQANRPDSPWSKWLKEDVAYIITESERNAFLQLTTDEEREKFVEQFWLRRDPTPDTIENEFKEEHYRRIAYANEHFSSRVPGWKSDRGRVYIQFGPPDAMDSHPAGGAYDHPTEDWTYRFIQGIGNDVLIEFADTAKNGEYHVDPTELDSLKILPTISVAPAQQLRGMPPQFKDLEDAIGAIPTYTILPMQVRIDYLRVTESSVMANITVQFDNRDLQFQSGDGGRKATVHLLGRISTMTRRPVTTFEKPLETDAPRGTLIYQQSVPLAPGRYRLNIVAEDTASHNLNRYEVALDVPPFETDKLASSSLILADTIEKLPAKTVGGNMFSIGDSRVRPRPGNKFTSAEKMGIYLELYNFRSDTTTQKPSGSIEYEIDKAGSNEKVMGFSEDAGGIVNASASQVTIEKVLPLSRLAPGAYTLKVTAIDKNGNQTVQQQANFAVSLE
jgi:GWxTD domain-containing protein